ncbi:MAG: polymerase subunit gamma/tau [Patescibacteria group bacterium]|nr:polymerase subunit gamma/tau [Patescibacteria group bacterium]
MSRSALYREYRPADLSDVVGQEHITRLLEASLEQQKLSHAYLFTGPRGTGKTSVARILARRVNELPADTGLESELDIIEIDAASNRGIDEIRALREKIATAPSRLKFKVFIIDEAHMLTREAFNALLKTLEEPPAHAVFILATTEVHKLPDTVISRTQRYDFRPVQPAGMLAHLQSVAQAESLQVDEDALGLIAELSGGGFRDALSLLDQLGSAHNHVTRQLVAEVAGIGDEEAVQQLIVLAAQGKSDEALGLLVSLWSQGAEPTLLTEHVLLVARRKFLQNEKGELSQTQLARILDSFMQAARELKTAPIPTLPVELAVWRLSPEAATLQAPAVITSATPSSRPVKMTAPQSVVAAAVPADLPGDVLGSDKVTAKALSLIKSKNNSLYAVLRSGDPLLQGDKLIVRCRFRFHKERIEEPKNQQFIEAVFSKVANRQIEMVVQHTGDQPAAVAAPADEELVASALEILGGEVVQE